MDGCSRTTCQIPGCDEEARHVCWFKYEKCPEEVAALQLGQEPWLIHVHQCEKHGHVHLCDSHFDKVYEWFSPEGMLLDPAAVAALEYD